MKTHQALLLLISHFQGQIGNIIAESIAFGSRKVEGCQNTIVRLAD